MNFITTKVLGIACGVLVVMLVAAGFNTAVLRNELHDAEEATKLVRAQYDAAVAQGQANAATAYAKGLQDVKDKELRLTELTNQLEKERANSANQDAAVAAAARNRVVAAGGLRDPYATPSRCSASAAGANAQPPAAAVAAGAEAPGQLSGRTTERVFAFADEVEKLARDYATCKAYVDRVRPLVNAGPDPYR